MRPDLARRQPAAAGGTILHRAEIRLEGHVAGRVPAEGLAARPRAGGEVDLLQRVVLVVAEHLAGAVDRIVPGLQIAQRVVAIGQVLHRTGRTAIAGARPRGDPGQPASLRVIGLQRQHPVRRRPRGHMAAGILGIDLGERPAAAAFRRDPGRDGIAGRGAIARVETGRREVDRGGAAIARWPNLIRSSFGAPRLGRDPEFRYVSPEFGYVSPEFEFGCNRELRSVSPEFRRAD